MSGSSTAPEESVMRELVAAFGEEKARRIMGDTTPKERRKPVPLRVGVAAKPLPALTRKPNGRPTLVELKNMDLAEGRRLRAEKVRIRRYHRTIRCAGCGRPVPNGEDIARVFRGATAKDYCGPCGAEEARRG